LTAFDTPPNAAYACATIHLAATTGEAGMSKPAISVEEDFVEGFSAQERRAVVRFRSSLEAPCRPVSDDAVGGWLAEVRDVSALGVGLALRQPVQPGSLLEIDLACATHGQMRPVPARVVHLVPDPCGAWMIGCAFVRELDAGTLRDFQARRVQPRESNGRRWVRFPCDVETVCYSSDTAPGERVPARVLNISAGAVGLLLPCDFSPGSLLRLQLPSAGAAEAGLLLRVVRVLPHTDSCWFLGCEFSERLSDDEVEALL
jgi:hypothetical protein